MFGRSTPTTGLAHSMRLEMLSIGRLKYNQSTSILNLSVIIYQTFLHAVSEMVIKKSMLVFNIIGYSQVKYNLLKNSKHSI
jgi:hypothetical protein